MARRYGRNQKRAHRERIAALEGPWLRAVGKVPSIPARFVIEWDDRTSEFERRLRREADVLVMLNPPLEAMILEQNRNPRMTGIEWHGVMWELVETRVAGRHRHDTVGGAPFVRLRLAAMTKRGE